jgi:hypothetical protein
MRRVACSHFMNIRSFTSCCSNPYASREYRHLYRVSWYSSLDDSVLSSTIEIAVVDSEVDVVESGSAITGCTFPPPR